MADAGDFFYDFRKVAERAFGLKILRWRAGTNQSADRPENDHTHHWWFPWLQLQALCSERLTKTAISTLLTHKRRIIRHKCYFQTAPVENHRLKCYLHIFRDSIYALYILILRRICSFFSSPEILYYCNIALWDYMVMLLLLLSKNIPDKDLSGREMKFIPTVDRIRGKNSDWWISSFCKKKKTDNVLVFSYSF